MPELAFVGFRRYFGAYKANWVRVIKMSRSYKRYPIVRQERVDKKTWNRAIRNIELNYSLKGSQYKKVMPNWDTWKYLWTLEEAVRDYQPSKRFPTLDSWILYWKKLCLYK